MADNIKPTLRQPTVQGDKFQKNFNKTMNNYGVKLAENEMMLNEKEQSLKRKIFSLDKMEALVFSDPKLSAVYDSMSENGAEKYGYHYNETIMNMIFNDYVLNSSKYLQKYKMAIPKEKKRRDKSGINQLKKSVEDSMTTIKTNPEVKPPVTEGNNDITKVVFLVNESDPENHDVFAYFPEENYDNQGRMKTGYSHIGQHSGVDPRYAEESRPATPEEYQSLKTELESIGYNLDVLNEKLSETTTAGSAGGAAGYVGYAGPAAWGSGDLLKKGQTSPALKKPIWKGGTVIQESNYLVDSNGFEKFYNQLNEQTDADFIKKNSDAFSVDKMNPNDKKIIKKDIQSGTLDNANLKTMEENTDISEVSKSKSQQRFMGMVHAVQKGELSPSEVGGKVEKAAKSMKEKDVEDFASTKHKNLPEKVDEDTQTMIQSNNTSMSNKSTPTGDQSTNVEMGTNTSSSMSESVNLLEELNNELNAFSVHHEKLKKMSEDRRPSSLVMKDRLGNENEKNFKQDLQHSGTKEIIDVEKELQYKDQQTEVGKDPQKLANDIEKAEIKVTDGTALDNVGDSANDKGNEVPKRNLNKEEQDEVNNYRLGLGDLVYDNEPGKRFEDRMKADMGDKLYQERQDKLAFRAKAPMYNKDVQPTEKASAPTVEFNKEKSGWNEREGLKEGMVSGKYFDVLDKKRIIDFNLNEVQEINTVNQTGLFEVSLEGMGNTYTSKVNVNESAVKAINNYKFYTDGKQVFALKNQAQNLSESENKGAKTTNEQYEKMRHLTGYKPSTYTDTHSVKKNRGF